jgi:hypothetical protein
MSLTLEDVAANLAYFESTFGVREVVVAGGEPTDRHDLPLVLAALHALPRLERVTVISRGVRWRSLDLLDVARTLPLVVVYSFDVWTEADWAPAAWQLIEGSARVAIGALAKNSISVTSNTVLTRALLQDPPRVASALCNLPLAYSSLTYPFPISDAVSGAVDLIPSVDDARTGVALFARQFAGSGRDWGLKGIPSCWVPEFRGKVSKTKQRLAITPTAQFDHAFPYLPNQLAFTQTDECRGCAARGECDGTWPEYLADPGFPALRAFA